ncbi:MAG: chemotaxis protein MotB, partial [Proteobacteria bacterium]
MRKRREESPENHERWLVSYADFITLLFAFFVVMYATSTSNLEKQKEFESSVRANLNLSTGAANSKATATPDAGAIIAEYIQGKDGPDAFPRNGSPGEAADFASRFLTKKIDKAAAKELGLEVNHDTVGVRVSLAASAFFQAGDFKLKLSSLEALNQLA